MNPARLPREFFARPTLTVTRDLLGMRLVHLDNGIRLSGIITEAEAYAGEEDDGCHARAGRTKRTEVMYHAPGHAYIYFTYGMHWMLCFVTEREGFPAAILIRAVEPVEGLDVIAARRAPQPRAKWTNGPGKLTRAFGIDGTLHGMNTCAPGSRLFLERGTPLPDSRVTTTPRVGLNNVKEPWKSIKWRFLVKGERNWE
jgi:DNA-3-methyladenine glycosylase